MKHFRLEELVSRYIFESQGEDAWKLFDPEALLMLDDFHEFIGETVGINTWLWGGSLEHRGARTLADEVALHGPGHSAHIADPEKQILCQAFDLDVTGMSAEGVRQKILANKDNPLLQRITRFEAGVTWVHMDKMILPAGEKRIYLFKS